MLALVLALTVSADEGGGGARVIGVERSVSVAAVRWTRTHRRLQPPPPACPGGSLQKCVDSCPSAPLPVYQACVKECGERCPPPGPPPMNTLDVVSVDPSTLAVTTLAKDVAGDLLSTGDFGAVGGGKFFTLAQPNNTGSIHLASWDLQSPFKKSIVPLPTTVVDGGYSDGMLVGLDEDDEGVYFARIDPATGTCSSKTILNKAFGFDGDLSAIDPKTKTLYYAAPPKHGGTNFTLIGFVSNFRPCAAVDCHRVSPGGILCTLAREPDTALNLLQDTSTGKIKSQVTLHPTPDSQGPAGLVWDAASAKILALMPPVGGSWQLVAINPQSGLVEQTTGLSAVSPMHGRAGGVKWLVPIKGKAVLSVGLFAGMGDSCQLISIDVQCALKKSPLANCTLGSSRWPKDPSKTTEVADLAVDLGL